jgi:prepilin-type processing-associated H-X9-DG protein
VNPSGLWKGAAFTDYGGIYGVEGAGRNREHETSGDNDVANEFKPEQTLRDDSLGVLLYDEPVAPKHVIDGLSKTACIAETLHRRRSECEWVNGNNIFAHEESTPINTDSGLSNDIGSPHPGGASLAFCDGSVRFVVETVEQKVLNAMLTKAGDE